MHHSLLHVEELSKTYPSGFTLRIDRLRLETGERVGLVGNNGAGKTTLLLLIQNLLRRDGGQVRMKGRDIRSFDAWRRATASYVGESSLIGFLTAREYWSFVGRAYGMGRDERRNELDRYTDFLGLAEQEQDKLIREFSTGARKKIGLVAAMMVTPTLLLLDEPFAGLDPRSQAILGSTLGDLNREHGTTLFVSSHDLGHVVEVCARIIIVDKGRLVQDAPVCPGSLRDIRSYLTGPYPLRAAQ